ncbi:MAG: type II secretion system protein, partial [Synergistaceae bacterium]|nr:type II secretion system protein [Synergistaceae bacterium]
MKHCAHGNFGTSVSNTEKVFSYEKGETIIMKRATNRKGFTLVELLIVIVVIGILSAMMMLSSTEAVNSAKASNVVSNLRNLKTAALALYVDKLDDFESKKFTDSGHSLTIVNVENYLNSGQELTGGYTYGITA